MDESRRPLSPDQLPDHESGLRRLMADAAGQPYHAFSSLADAQRDPDGVVIFEGDDGGQIYVVAPARAVQCPEETLRQLLLDLDALAWQDPSMAHLVYERHQPGDVVPGGKGGGQVEDRLWVHPEFSRWEADISAVLTGRISRISLGAG